MKITFSVHNDNPDTIWGRLKEKLGREPTDEEVRAEVKRILTTPRPAARAQTGDDDGKATEKPQAIHRTDHEPVR